MAGCGLKVMWLKLLSHVQLLVEHSNMCSCCCSSGLLLFDKIFKVYKLCDVLQMLQYRPKFSIGDCMTGFRKTNPQIAHLVFRELPI